MNILATEIRPVALVELYALQSLLICRGLVGMLLLALHGLVLHNSLSFSNARRKLAFARCHIVVGSDTILGLVHTAAMVIASVRASFVRFGEPVVRLLRRVHEVVGVGTVVVPGSRELRSGLLGGSLLRGLSLSALEA